MRAHSGPIALWAPNDYVAAEQAWQSGWGDLPYAAQGRPVPGMVALGVLGHASWERLRDLAGARRSGPVRRIWGPEIQDVIATLLRTARTPERLHQIQTEILVPRERELLNAGTVTITRGQLIDLVDDAVAVLT